MRKNIIIILNSVIALILGLTIYIVMKGNTYINTILCTGFNYIPKTLFGVFVVNWFCDFLWAYSLVFALYFVLAPFAKRHIVSSVVTMIFGTILECLQAFDIVSGTFDWWDIVIEVVAAFIAMIVLKLIDKKTALHS